MLKTIQQDLIKKIETLKADIVIFFAPGGWGYVSPEKETYAKSLLEGIQKTLNSWQQKIVVVNYPRTKSNLLGKIKGFKETLFAFPSESKKLANLIENLKSQYRKIKIILIGYSLGGAFINEVMKKIKEKKGIYCIQAGTPFFYPKLKSENILHLDNNGKDALAKGDIKKLILIGVLGILKLVFLFKLIRLKISESFHFKDHEYFWENSEIRLKIENFLKSNLLKYAPN